MTMPLSEFGTASELSLIAGAALLAWIISFAIRSALKKDRKDASGYANHRTGAKNLSFPEPQRYLVYGVEQETGKDTVVTITADSEANAAVKADMKKIRVTRVDHIR